MIPSSSTENTGSPVAHRLNTNYVPSEGEVRMIQQYLCDPTDRLSRLESEITRIQAVLENLRDERDKISAHIKSHHALISPVRQLPQDIWREIFVACLPSDRNAVMSAKEAPVLLGQVCSAWRSVSHTSPRLWSSVHIPIPISSSDQLKLRERHLTVQSWLCRSATCPLSISIQSADYAPDILSVETTPQRDILGAVMETLLSFSRRWKHVYFSLPPSHLSMLSRLSQHDVPLVETFTIICPEWGANFDLKAMNMLQAPRLRSLTISSVHNDFLSLPIHWSNLTEVDIKNIGIDMTLNNILTVANMCPNLVTYRITTYIDRDEEVPRGSVTLLHLQRLSFVDLFDATELFNRLNMPSLRHIDYSAYNTLDASVPLLTLLHRTTHLESLTIDWMQYNSYNELFECLELAPHLTALKIVIFRYSSWTEIEGEMGPLCLFDDESLEQFLPSSDRGDRCLCPRLESFDCVNASFSEELLLRVVKERANISNTIRSNVTPLKRVNVGFDRIKKVDTSAELQRLAAGGVQMSLEYRDSSFFDPWSGLPKAEEVLEAAVIDWPTP